MQVSTLAGIAAVAVHIDGLLRHHVIAGHPKQSAPLMPMIVASRGPVVVRTGTLRGCSGILEQAFVAYIFAMANATSELCYIVGWPRPLTLTSSHD